MTRFIVAGLILLGWTACKPEAETQNRLKMGTWRAVVEIQGQQLPFNFEVSRDEKGGYDVHIINGEERLLLDEVEVRDDSVDIALHIFDANFRARIAGDSLRGVFVKNFANDYELPFVAVYGQAYRFPKTNIPEKAEDFSGKYDVTFFRGADETEAVAIFNQSGDVVTGTFLTATGDYRYLSGNAAGRSLKLSSFDGDNIYLFHATLQQDGKLQGEFYSGKTRRETWVAVKNDNASPPGHESQTYLKEGYERIAFSFPDVNGKKVSSGDEKYEGKVVIVQLMGTWCPNCLDETKFLVPWYNENKDRGVEIVGLAYENKDDFNYASVRVKKMMEKIGVPYDVLIAGTTNRETRGKTLPMLNDITAFPTTIFIGKDGTVRKIHTGFAGPGTGEYFEQFKKDFNETVDALLREGLTAGK
jgi:thiol-disulfide isomerase/thioredoxin